MEKRLRPIEYIRLKAQIANSNGQSLVQVLISVAIMGIVMMTFATMLTNQSRETLAITQKLAIMDFQQQLTRSFADGTLCTTILNGLTFQPPAHGTGSFTLAASSIPISHVASAPALATKGLPLSALTTTVTANSPQPFEVTNITGHSDGTTGVYSGNFQVNLTQSSLVRALNPPSTVITMNTTGVSTQTINSCTVSTINCGSGYVVTGINSNGTPVCTQSSGAGNLSCTVVTAVHQGSGSANMTATCPNGYFVTGGGGTEAGASYPNGNGWNCSGSKNYDCYAVCCMVSQ